ncbi:alpha-L-fucosidase [Nibricoccus sp. IMCC34717]|uniref:alpha-L-fucosidase n=1 Tax=Nibricoccus sp. IMCC34717 TaxID=3034021 RepID=UPI0038515229
MLSVSLLRRFTVLAVTLTASLAAQNAPAGYEPSWSSLNRHLVGRWFPQARFGIAVQFSVASVPGQSRDYARLMYLPPEPTVPNPIWVYQEKHYGHPSVFGYKDLLPYFEAPRWDPAALAATFKAAGARYVVPVAIDRDNIDLFDSRHHGWNTKRFGPHRNLAADWATALRAAGLRVGFSLHNGRAWDVLRPAQGSEWEGPHADKPFDGALTSRDGTGEWWAGLDPRDLYGRTRPGNAFAPLPPQPVTGASGPDRAWQENWYKRANDLLTQVKPDLLLIEGGLPHGDWGLRLAADFFTLAHGNRRDITNGVALILPPTSGAAPAAYVAQGKRDRNGPWQAELDLARDGIRTDVPPACDAATVLARLAETTASGGNLLLRVALRPDGTLPDDQAAILREVGAWLEKKGKVIFDAEPGPMVKSAAPARTFPAVHANGNTFVFFTRWPGATTVPLEGLPPGKQARWSNGAPARVEQDGPVLRVQTPAQAPDAPLCYLELVGTDAGFVE